MLPTIKIILFSVCGFVLASIVGYVIVLLINANIPLDTGLSQILAIGCIGLVLGALLGRRRKK